MSKASPGITVLEYSLSGVLVLALCVVGFQTMGFGLGSRLQGLKQEMLGSIQSAEHQEALSLAARSNAEEPPSAAPAPNPAPIPGALPATSLSPDEFSRMIATLGANGATSVLANQLTRQVDQWLQEGAITNAEASSLIQLANAGYRLADAQNHLEQALKTGKKQVSYNGKTYSTKDFAYAFRYIASKSEILALDPKGANELVKPFAQTYQQVLRNDAAMSNSLIKNMVKEMAIQISVVTDALGYFGQKVDQSRPFKANDFYATVNTEFHVKMKSAPVFQDVKNLTGNNSGQICTTGSGKAEGNVCVISNDD